VKQHKVSAGASYPKDETLLFYKNESQKYLKEGVKYLEKTPPQSPVKPKRNATPQDEKHIKDAKEQKEKDKAKKQDRNFKRKLKFG